MLCTYSQYFQVTIGLQMSCLVLFQDGEEVSRLKETIRKLREGEYHDEGDADG